MAGSRPAQECPQSTRHWAEHLGRCGATAERLLAGPTAAALNRQPPQSQHGAAAVASQAPTFTPASLSVRSASLIRGNRANCALFSNNLDWLVSKLDRLEASSGERRAGQGLILSGTSSLELSSSLKPVLFSRDPGGVVLRAHRKPGSAEYHPGEPHQVHHLTAGQTRAKPQGMASSSPPSRKASPGKALSLWEVLDWAGRLF